MFKSSSFPSFFISGAKLRTLNLAIAFYLVINPYFALAEQDSAKLNLQAVAESNAQELNEVTANEYWTRIEFSNAFIDPIVVVELLTANGDNPYIVGIRNIDTLGFEMSLKSCNNSMDTPLQETINYSVIEHSQSASTEQANTEIRQHFAWGECPT